MPVAPGGILEDELEARGISADKFADSIGLSIGSLKKLFRGKICLDASIAAKIEGQLGLDASFWLALQADYEDDLEYHAKKKTEKRHALLKKLTKPWNKVAF